MTPARVEPDMDSYSGRLAHRLRELRETAGYSVEETIVRMARFGFEIKAPRYRHWEAGRSQPDWNAVPALAKSLKVKKISDLIPRK